MDSLRSYLAFDVGLVEQFVGERLAGHQVRWAPDPDDRNALCVRDLVLEETEIHLGQLEDLKKRLRRFRLPGRALVYRFPSS